MRSWTTGQMFAAMAAGAMIAGMIGVAVTREPPGADITLPGSPLYAIAVTESVKGQAGDQNPVPAAEPCPDCGQIHAAPEAAIAAHSHPAAAASTNYVYCANCKAYHYVAPQDELGGTGESPTPTPVAVSEP